jgi:biopolymer transport protein ExbD
MAEINTADKSDGKKRSKKMSTKVDMTPMVDLAFLLITFFMLTTTLTKKNAMSINLPDKNEHNVEVKIPFENTVTIILGENDKIYWYIDPKNPSLNVTDYSREGVRKLLKERKQAADTFLVAIIKPMKNSKYKNLVDMMDEVNIMDVRKSAIGEISKEEEQMVADYRKKFNL